jgi:hypothetical protein
MEDHLGPAHGSMDSLVRPQVSLYDLHLAEQRRQVLTAAGGEVVEDPDPVAVPQERPDEIRPPVTSTSLELMIVLLRRLAGRLHAAMLLLRRGTAREVLWQ